MKAGLRILGERKKGYWLATCLELNLMATGASYPEAFDSLMDAIDAYLDTVLDTDDKLSFTHLLCRPAPLSKRFCWEFVYHTSRMKKWFKAMTIDSKSFKDYSHHCATPA